MCIIIDTCCAGTLTDAALPQGKLILDWVRGGGKVVSGGKLEKELKGTKLQKLMVQWSSSGRLIAIDADKIKNAYATIDESQLRSNDLHVIALAKVTGSRVVVTRDDDLIYDLKKSGQAPNGQKIYPCPPNPVTNLRIQRGVLRNSNCK